jgi:hypothetical protein
MTYRPLLWFRQSAEIADDLISSKTDKSEVVPCTIL